MNGLISKIQFTKNQKKILKSALEPPSTEWLWLKTQNGVSTLYDYVNGRWTAVGGNKPGTSEAPNNPIDVATKADLSTAILNLDKSLRTEFNSFSTKSWVTSELDNFGSKVTGLMNGYAEKFYVDKTFQKLLTPGNNVSIKDNVISFDYSQVVDDTVTKDSSNAVSGKAVFNALDELQSDIDGKQDKLIPGTNVTIDENTNTINVTVSGGGGGGSSVHFVNDGTSVPSDSEDLYFFSRSPLQVEGAYNNLLREGTEKGITFSPDTLYNLNEECDFSVLNSRDLITVNGNSVYFNGEPTGWHYYGELVLSNRIKYAETSDSAYLSFMVSSPFYAKETRVTMRFDNTIVRVERLVSNKQWQAVSNGQYFSMGNNNTPTEYMFRIIRLDGEQANIEAMDTTVTFNNGFKDYPVQVKFSKCRLYFKEGTCYNGFDPSNPPEVNAALFANVGKTGCTYTPGSDYFFVGSPNTYCCIAKEVPVDESRFNVFYAVVKSVPNSWFRCVTFWPEWGGVSASNHEKRVYNSTDYTNLTTTTTASANNAISRFGSYVLNCLIHNERVGDTVNLDLLLTRAGSGGMNVVECGLLTYEPIV